MHFGFSEANVQLTIRYRSNTLRTDLSIQIRYNSPRWQAESRGPSYGDEQPNRTESGHTMGHIKPTNHGSYRAYWRDETGKQFGKTFKRRGDAVNHLKTVEGQVVGGEFIDPKKGRVTLREWTEECLELAYNLEESSRQIDQRGLNHMLPVLGDIQLANLTSEDIERYFAVKLKTLAPTTVARQFKTLRWMLNRAVEKERIRKNPCTGVSPPAWQQAEMRFLSVTDVLALTDALPSQWKAWALFMATSGLRWSESIGLPATNVHLLRRKVDVHQQLMWSRTKKEWEVKLPKSKGKRTVTIPWQVADSLGEHIGQYPNELVFTNSAGNPMQGSSFTGQIFKPALVRAGLDRGTRIHDLRHTSVAWAIKEGAHPKAIQTRMGHSSIVVTLDMYGHLFPELDDELADRMGKSLLDAVEGRNVVHFQDHRDSRAS